MKILNELNSSVKIISLLRSPLKLFLSFMNLVFKSINFLDHQKVLIFKTFGMLNDLSNLLLQLVFVLLILMMLLLDSAQILSALFNISLSLLDVLLFYHGFLFLTKLEFLLIFFDLLFEFLVMPNFLFQAGLLEQHALGAIGISIRQLIHVFFKCNQHFLVFLLQNIVKHLLVGCLLLYY